MGELSLYVWPPDELVFAGILQDPLTFEDFTYICLILVATD